MPTRRTKKKAQEAVNSSQESAGADVRTSTRLKNKGKTDFAILSGKKKKVQVNDTVEHDEEASNVGHVSQNSSQNGDTTDTRSDLSSSVDEENSIERSEVNSTEEEEEEEVQLAGSKKQAEQLLKIEHDMKARIASYKNMLKKGKKFEKEKARKVARRKEMEKIEEENNRRLQRIAELQREEDELARIIKHDKKDKRGRDKGRRKSKLRSRDSSPPSAQSTPKTKSEYNNIIQHILNLSFNESDMMMVDRNRGQRKLAPTKVKEIQSLLEGSVLKTNKCKVTVDGRSKRKEHEMSSSEEDGEVSQVSEGSTPKRKSG